VATFAKAVVKEVNLLRRPILLVGKRAIVGFDEAAYAKL
jgi:arsenate reductase-like glutaredoxin family protein